MNPFRKLIFWLQHATAWQTFSYNYQWADYVRYIDGWLPRFAIFFPLIGYLILFNDTATEYLEFEDLAKPSELYSGLVSPVRLRLLYCGLLFLAASNALYRIKRPPLFKYGTDEVSFTQTALENFNYSTFARLRNDIFRNGHVTKDVDDEDGFWDEFVAEAVRDLETVTCAPKLPPFSGRVSNGYGDSYEEVTVH